MHVRPQVVCRAMGPGLAAAAQPLCVCFPIRRGEDIMITAIGGRHLYVQYRCCQLRNRCRRQGYRQSAEYAVGGRTFSGMPDALCTDARFALVACIYGALEEPCVGPIAETSYSMA
ncbi:hypothetical protein GY45DRAFT_742403 [Cubamyces sp. BRFM 1775]|nr:hypothetical protein GY45DRAFT_742403 [Cubamyces sp. BRFM 1775]